MTASLLAPWLPAADAAPLAGRSHWSLRQALARGVAHGHHSHPGSRAGMWFVLEEPLRLLREGANEREQARHCPCCLGLVPPPPRLLGRARRRHHP